MEGKVGFAGRQRRAIRGAGATPQDVTGLTPRSAARHQFRCGIKGLRAESATLNEDFRRTAAAVVPSAEQPHHAGPDAGT
ncbi:MAG: hypothetical protein OEY03_00530, partial [Rhizobacter sp.]|nr:hypothetical protein [Rhizobacter sp.]